MKTLNAIIVLSIVFLINCGTDEPEEYLSESCQRYIYDDYPVSDYPKNDIGCYYVVKDPETRRDLIKQGCVSSYRYNYIVDSLGCNGISSRSKFAFLDNEQTITIKEDGIVIFTVSCDCN